MPTTRRDFVSTSTKALGSSALAAIGLSSWEGPAVTRVSAADKLVIALIGCRNMGFGDLQNALKVPGVECGAICDVDQEVIDKRSADIAKIQGKAPLHYKDYRKLLENKDINAVIIGTPDHWHCLPFIAACEAGKDVYVEKSIWGNKKERDLGSSQAGK